MKIREDKIYRYTGSAAAVTRTCAPTAEGPTQPSVALSSSPRQPDEGPRAAAAPLPGLGSRTPTSPLRAAQGLNNHERGLHMTFTGALQRVMCRHPLFTVSPPFINQYTLYSQLY